MFFHLHNRAIVRHWFKTPLWERHWLKPDGGGKRHDDTEAAGGDPGQ